MEKNNLETSNYPVIVKQGWGGGGGGLVCGTLNWITNSEIPEDFEYWLFKQLLDLKSSIETCTV